MARAHASSVINAPIEQVWARIRDFNGLPNWHPGVARSEIEGGAPADQVGCVRHFALKDGGVIRERLLEMSDLGHHYSYAILELAAAGRRLSRDLASAPDLRRKPHLCRVERHLRPRPAGEAGGSRGHDRQRRVPGRLQRAEEALRRLAELSRKIAAGGARPVDAGRCADRRAGRGRLRHDRGAERRLARGRARRVRRPARLIGLRQDHAVARDLRLRAVAQRPDPARRARHHRACRRSAAAWRWCSSPTPCGRT